MRTKPTMRKKMLRSVLVAAFSVVMTFGALSGLSDAGSAVSADSHWPSASTVVSADDSHWPNVAASDGGADVSAAKGDSGERT